ncbi:MAG: hypothetical protein AAF532_01460 [Planctomycetota bacterium]
MSFQLTPLLDLLLIVLFAQFLDVRGTSREAEARYREEAAVARAEVDRELAAGRAELEAARVELADRRAEISAAAAAVDVSKSFLEADRDELLAVTERAASLMAELFDVPQDVIDEMLTEKAPPAVPSDAAAAERLRERLRDLAKKAGRAVVEHLVTYDELLKRADVWRVRVADDGRVTLTAGDRESTFRATSVDQFVSRATEAYYTFPEPKGVVLVVVSYGDARADVRTAVLDGVDRWLRELRTERLGRTQFAPAVLGYLPDETDGSP